MSALLLDANVLVALMWPAHQSHAPVHQWFRRNARRGWATCPLTQTAFVRIVSNPAFSRDAVGPEEALALLAANLQDGFHRFWADDISCEQGIELFRGRLHGHQQVTDAYLLGLAIYNRGKLVTMDRGLVALLPAQSPERNRIEILAAEQ